MAVLRTVHQVLLVAEPQSPKGDQLGYFSIVGHDASGSQFANLTRSLLQRGENVPTFESEDSSDFLEDFNPPPPLQRAMNPRQSMSVLAPPVGSPVWPTV